MKSIVLKANAKINLFLDITGRRADGYHELESVMMSVGIADILKFEKTDKAGIEIICDKAGFPLDERNIIYKAAKALFDELGLNGKAGLCVKVQKNIPSEAGMGGGSADGAATLIAVNRLFELGISEQRLIEVGAKIGADVPFCIKGGCCICKGIGDRLDRISICTPLPMIIIKPKVSVSTPKAYKGYDDLKAPIHRDINEIVTALESKDNKMIAQHLFNAFELVIQEPEINDAKKLLIDSGAAGALMTGSGSAVFGIFESYEHAQNAFEKIKTNNINAYLCKSEFNGTETISEG